MGRADVFEANTQCSGITCMQSENVIHKNNYTLN